MCWCVPMTRGGAGGAGRASRGRALKWTETDRNGPKRVGSRSGLEAHLCGSVRDRFGISWSIRRPKWTRSGPSGKIAHGNVYMHTDTLVQKVYNAQKFACDTESWAENPTRGGRARPKLSQTSSNQPQEQFKTVHVAMNVGRNENGHGLLPRPQNWLK